MYIKLSDFTGVLEEGDTLLMSHEEFLAGGKSITGVPVTITPDGSEPVEIDMNDEINRLEAEGMV